MSENTDTERKERAVVLDLDELLGLSPTIKVRWKGREFEMRHMRTLDPESLAQFLRLQTKLSQAGDADDAESFLRMAEAQDELLAIICPELAAAELSFMQKVQVLGFYMDRLEQEYGLGEAQSLPIGEASSPA